MFSCPRLAALLAALALASGCTSEPPAVRPTPQPPAASMPVATLADYLSTLTRHVDSLDALLHPVALLTRREQAALSRYPNRDQLARARMLGATGTETPEGRAALVEQRRLVRLPDTTDYWIVRKLDHSSPSSPRTRRRC